MHPLKIVLLFAVSGLTFSVQAQTTKRTSSKYKPPKLYTLLSTYKDSAFVNSSEAVNMISLPIRIVDGKKNIYAISSYQFLYRKNVVTEDEQTGKVSPAISNLSDRFKVAPLPEPWINKVREDIKAGEMLYFFDIIVKDQQGRVMYAPDLKIIVQ